MTSIFLLISKFFIWTFGIFEFAGNLLNWVLFLAATAIFCYWCYILLTTLGGNKDNAYVSPTGGKHPYYDPKIYRKENK